MNNRRKIVVIGARINSVRIKFSEGGTGSVKAGRLFLLDKVAAPKKGDKVRQSKVSPKVPKPYEEPKPKPKKDKDTKPAKTPKTEPKPTTPAVTDNQVEVLISMYNGIYTLIADVEDPDSKKLKKLGFRFQGQYYLLKIKNKQMGQTVMKALKRKFNIPKKNVDIIEEMFDEMKRSKYVADPPDNLKLFLRLSHQTVDDKKTLRVYPMVEDDGMYLVVNRKTHPHLTPAKLKVGAFTWKTERGYWYYFAKNRTALKTMVKTLATQKKSFLTVTNIPELKEAIKEHYNVKV
jgi:glucan-binding YG repeat protein